MYMVNGMNGICTCYIWCEATDPISMHTHSTSVGGDYTGGPYSVFFRPGENVISFNVPIANDLVAELPEAFFLDLEIPPAADSMSIVKGPPDSATVNIRDDDSEYMGNCTAL